MKATRTVLVVLATAATAVVFAPSHTVAADNKAAAPRRQAQPSKPDKSGYVEDNGVNYYYQIRGKGEPLLLLHGGLGQIEMFGPVLTELARRRQVIGIDLHGHGRTALGDRPIRYADMGDDMAAILQRLGHARST